MNCFLKQVTFQINGIAKLKLKFYSKENNTFTLIVFGFINDLHFLFLQLTTTMPGNNWNASNILIYILPTLHVYISPLNV